MSYLVAAALFAVFAGVGLAPAISKRFGKKPAMIGVFFASLFTSVTPIAMRLLGLLPSNGTQALFAIVFGFQFIAATLRLSGFIIVISMMADVVEDVAVETGNAWKACCLPPTASYRNASRVWVPSLSDSSSPGSAFRNTRYLAKWTRRCALPRHGLPSDSRDLNHRWPHAR